MTVPSRKEELERRLEQSRRLLKDANDPTTKERIGLLIYDLMQEQIIETRSKLASVGGSQVTPPISSYPNFYDHLAVLIDYRDMPLFLFR